jgi:hypothetical protein
MPKLQIDSIDIAEIDGNLAKKLMQSASQRGIGRTPKPSAFQTQVASEMSKPRQHVEAIKIDLEF